MFGVPPAYDRAFNDMSSCSAMRYRGHLALWFDPAFFSGSRCSCEHTESVMVYRVTDYAAAVSGTSASRGR